MRKYFIGLLFLSLFTAPLSAQVEEPKWQLYKMDNYKLEYPNDWKIVESQNKEWAEFYLVSPLTSKVDSFQDNVTLAIKTLNKSNNTLAKFSKFSEHNIGHYVDDSQIITSETLGKKKKAFHRIEYTATYPKTKGVRWIQYYFIKEDKAYIVTGMMENDQQEYFAPLMESILKTFKLMKKS
jgi:hypothetical protein